MSIKLNRCIILYYRALRTAYTIPRNTHTGGTCFRGTVALVFQALLARCDRKAGP